MEQNYKSKYGFETTPLRSKIMSKIKGKNTKPELILRKNLWSEGVRYRINNKKLIGNPDIAIKKYKIAIFVDGEFWHGYNWKEKKSRLKTNTAYWIKKIEGNINRDKIHNKNLESEGWIVLRFWEKEIRNNLNNCVEVIKSAIENQKR